MPPDRATLVALTTLYVFLTQLKFRWAFWLPVYAFAYPAYWVSRSVLTIFGKVVAFVVSGFWKLFTAIRGSVLSNRQ